MSERYPEPIWREFALWSADGKHDRLRIDIRYVVSVHETERRYNHHGGMISVATIRMHDGVEYTVLDDARQTSRVATEREPTP